VLTPTSGSCRPDTVPRLAHHFMHSQVGLVAPALELSDGRCSSPGARRTPLNLMFRRWIGASAAGQARGRRRVTVGRLDRPPLCLGADRRVDERYFLYFDDVDYCHRLRTAGWSVRFDPTVRAIHAFGERAPPPDSVGDAPPHPLGRQRFFTEHPRYCWIPGRARSAAGAAQRARLPSAA